MHGAEEEERCALRRQLGVREGDGAADIILWLIDPETPPINIVAAVPSPHPLP